MESNEQIAKWLPSTNRVVLTRIEPVQEEADDAIDEGDMPAFTIRDPLPRLEALGRDRGPRVECNAILVRRPFADAIMAPLLWPKTWPKDLPTKPIEFRSYATDYRGPLVIVASAQPVSLADEWRAAFRPLFDHAKLFYRTLGVVRLDDVRPVDPKKDDEVFGGAAADGFAWCIRPIALLPHYEFPNVCAGCLDLEPGTDRYARHQRSSHVKMVKVRLPRLPAIERAIQAATG